MVFGYSGLRSFLHSQMAYRALFTRGLGCMTVRWRFNPTYCRSAHICCRTGPIVLSNQKAVWRTESLRWKKRRKHEEVEEVDSDDESFELDGASDGVNRKIRLPSVRFEVVVKGVLGISRKRIEAALFAHRFRINGVEPHKKAESIHLGDEIDLIKGFNEANPKLLDVSRFIVHNITTEEDGDEISFYVNVTRFKQMLIENYESAPYR